MTEQGRKLRMCQAELEQERRLTASLDKRLDDLNAANQNLVEKNDNQFTQIKGLQEAVRVDLKTISEMRDNEINATIEANVANDMVAQIVSAMEGAGYPVTGWGNDDDLIELESGVEAVEARLADVSATLDRVRTER